MYKYTNLHYEKIYIAKLTKKKEEKNKVNCTFYLHFCRYGGYKTLIHFFFIRVNRCYLKFAFETCFDLV